jgi:RNA polymerase sigma-70 factor (ECF subfamily)
MPATAIDRAARADLADRGDCGDDDLMLAYASGDAAAFDALYRRHKGGVYRYLLRQCGGAATADELFQDVWMNVIRSRASYAVTAKFTTWLYRIAGNRLVDHWRASGRADLVRAANADPAEGGDDDGDPLSTVAGPRNVEPEVRATAAEIGARLRNAVSALPPAQREAFLLHQDGGLELAEIAALTGAGVETVKSRLRYALARLRYELGDLR